MKIYFTKLGKASTLIGDRYLINPSWFAHFPRSYGPLKISANHKSFLQTGIPKSLNLNHTRGWCIRKDVGPSEAFGRIFLMEVCLFV